jgi:hypothetical protein
MLTDTPNLLKKVANSHPTKPPPIITIDFGVFSIEEMFDEESTLLQLIFSNFISFEPVAIIDL